MSSVNVENQGVRGSGSNPKLSSSQKLKIGDSGRKKLQTLQPSGSNQKLLVGGDGLLRMSGSKKKEGFKVFEDPKCSSTPERKTKKDEEVQATVFTKEGGSQVEEADTAQAKAEEFMYGEEYPPEYWRELAEKTREALERSLVENEELHTSLGLVEEEKEALKEENEGLKEMAMQAEELAKIVKGLTEEDDDNSEEETETEDEEEPGEV